MLLAAPSLLIGLLYGGGYIAQFMQNYHIWQAAGGTPGDGTSPLMPSFNIGSCLKGCIWLCKAAVSFDETRNVKFSTYAERIVINGLRTYCRLMCGKQKHHIQLPAQKKQDEEVFSLDQIPAEDTLEQLFEEQDIYILLQSMKQQYSGTIRLGIEAIEWKVKGFSGAEIAKMYGVKPNLVGAWISRASSRLKKNSDFMKYFNPFVEINSS